MKLKILLLLSFFQTIASAQISYFPPTTGNTWQKASLQEFNYDISYTDSLYQYLDDNKSKGFIVLYDGKIVVEKYFDQFTLDSAWYWASCAKSLTAFLVGIAEEDGLLDIGNPASNYLGQGWTNCTTQEEEAIKVWNILSMSSGIDDSVSNLNCTDPACFKFKANPGTRWAYHNGVYHKSHDMIEAVSGKSLNAYTTAELSFKTGISGLWINHIFFSKPRSMARFGLLMLNNGIWNQDTLLHNREYIDSMTVSSQSINPAYGLLWWLNGKDTFMIPQAQLRFPGSLTTPAPSDMYSALGKDDQKIYIVPSQKLVIIRVGEDPGTSLLGPSSFDSGLWEKINRWRSIPNALDKIEAKNLTLYPNPSNGSFQINEDAELISIYNHQGQTIIWTKKANSYEMETREPGIYFAQFETKSGQKFSKRFILISKN